MRSDLHPMGTGPADALVAGAGIWGCTVARRLAEAGRKVLVLEKRAAVGGNCRCAYRYLDMDKAIDAALKLNLGA